ncbi:mCG146258, partial [Mus musculus]
AREATECGRTACTRFCKTKYRDPDWEPRVPQACDSRWMAGPGFGHNCNPKMGNGDSIVGMVLKPSLEHLCISRKNIK